MLPLDVDAIERVLAEGGKMTRSKIAKALDIPNDGQLKKALEADERFILDGRTWAMAATSPGGVE